MPRYTLKSGGEEAEKQYANLPENTRQLVNQRIEELLENPTGNPDREYDEQFDSTPFRLAMTRDGSFIP
jgi:hypothetical protein